MSLQLLYHLHVNNGRQVHATVYLVHSEPVLNKVQAREIPEGIT